MPFRESRTVLDVVTCIQRHPDNAGGHACHSRGSCAKHRPSHLGLKPAAVHAAITGEL